MEKLLLRPAEVVEATGLCRSKVYAMIAVGVIPSIRVGRALRVPTASLHEWITRQIAEQEKENVCD